MNKEYTVYSCCPSMAELMKYEYVKFYGVSTGVVLQYSRLDRFDKIYFCPFCGKAIKYYRNDNKD